MYFFSWWRACQRHHHHHHRHSASAVTDLGFSHIVIHLSGVFMSVIIKGTVPVTRKSGASLSLTDVDSIQLFRNGEQIDSLAPSAPTFQFQDLTPLTGADDYTVKVLTKDGFISDPSNVASVNIAGADPATAVSDLTATVDVAALGSRRR
jgi:hypothetical protein